VPRRHRRVGAPGRGARRDRAAAGAVGDHRQRHPAAAGNGCGGGRARWWADTSWCTGSRRSTTSSRSSCTRSPGCSARWPPPQQTCWWVRRPASQRWGCPRRDSPRAWLRCFLGGCGLPQSE
jgi:hypothetical protein